MRKTICQIFATVCLAAFATTLMTSCGSQSTPASTGYDAGAYSYGPSSGQNCGPGG